MRYLAGMPPAHKRLYNEDVKHSLLQEFCEVSLTVCCSHMLCPSQHGRVPCTSDRLVADQLLTTNLTVLTTTRVVYFMYLSHVHQMLGQCL